MSSQRPVLLDACDRNAGDGNENIYNLNGDSKRLTARGQNLPGELVELVELCDKCYAENSALEVGKVHRLHDRARGGERAVHVPPNFPPTPFKKLPA